MTDRQNDNHSAQLLPTHTCGKTNNIVTTVQDNLLAKIIFSEFPCKKQLAGFILVIQTTTSFILSFFCLEPCLYGCICIVIGNCIFCKYCQSAIIITHQQIVLYSIIIYCLSNTLIVGTITMFNCIHTCMLLLLPVMKKF